jgi:CubicO group peptidase (beta-lactamase class C family)
MVHFFQGEIAMTSRTASIRSFRPLLFALAAWYMLFSGTILTAQTAAKKSVKKGIIPHIEEYINAAMRHDQFSGSILIAKDGVPILSKGYGMANYELSVPNTPQTVFRIASLTKQFTALAIMQLQERGKLSVNDSICKYLDKCPSAWQPVTIHHLLTHTSGIPNMSSLPDWDEKHSIQPYSPTETLDLVRNLPLQFVPGEKFKYSNSGYDALGLILEKISGMPFEQFLQDNIFTPTQMKNTGRINPRHIVKNRASGYYWSLGAFVNAPYENLLLPYSSGSLESTTGDLLLWDKALYTNKLLSEKSLNAVFTPFKKNYGYGWEITQKFNRTFIGHSGSLNGFSTYLLRVPSERVTVIVLSNSDETSATKMAYNLAAIVFGEEYKLPTPQIREILTDALLQKGAEAAAKQYHELKSTQPSKYDFSERLLNNLGYDLLTNGRVSDAIVIFTLNCEAFPQSSNVFDSLGEAYLLAKNYEKSLLNYKKALELEPKNSHAQEVIQKVEELLKKSQ